MQYIIRSGPGYHATVAASPLHLYDQNLLTSAMVMTSVTWTSVLLTLCRENASP